MTAKPESYEQDANNYATVVATVKVEEVKSQHYKKAVAIASGEFLAQISLKASELADAQIRGKHKDLFNGTEADLKNRFFINEHYAQYPKNFQTIKGEYSAAIAIRANELVATKSAKFDDYYATAFGDALNDFEKAFDTADFTSRVYGEWLLSISPKSETQNVEAEVICG